MKTSPLLTSLGRLLLVAAAVFGSLTARAATSFPNVLSVGPFNNSPTYYYINTKIPFNPGIAPQIRITGYMYNGTNKAMDVRLGWYMWNNAFYWTQYHSELSFAKPSRIRLGTYDDAGTTRVRIEIANDGVYWTSYFISATDILGNDPYYTGWSYVEGAMPGSTGLITEVPLQGDVQIFGNLSAANFANGTITGSSSGLTLNAGGTNQNITLTPSGAGYTILNGNVGIGTASPLRRLQLGGDVFGLGFEVAGGSPHSGALRFGDNTGWKFHIGRSRESSGGALNSGTTGALVTFQDNGNVGIGTTAPSTKLHVLGGSNYTGTIVADGPAAGYSSFGLYENGAYKASMYWHPGAGGVSFYGPSKWFFESGNLGIGTTNPTTKLDVQGGYIRAQDAGANSGAFVQGSNGVSYFGNLGANDIRLGNANNWGYLTIKDGGNVGIGTTSPSAKLQLDGGDLRLADTATQTPFIIKSYSNANSLWFMPASGSSVTTVFGTTHNWDSQVALQYTPGTTGAAGGQLILGQISKNAGTYTHGITSLYTNGGERVRIDSSGNVGIGTPSPNEPLEIAGSGRMFIGDGGGAARKGLLVDTIEDGTYVRLHAYNYGTTTSMNLVINPYGGGNVGIGTTTPSHKLAVNGTIRAKEIIVDTGWADYVFDESYALAPLSDVEAHIKAKKHLPGIPSAAEIAEHGVSMGDMQSKLLSKIEELTLHMIRIEKENSELRQRVQKLEATTTTP